MQQLGPRNQKRLCFGVAHTLFHELRDNDRKFSNYFRISSNSFDELPRKIQPFLSASLPISMDPEVLCERHHSILYTYNWMSDSNAGPGSRVDRGETLVTCSVSPLSNMRTYEESVAWFQSNPVNFRTGYQDINQTILVSAIIYVLRLQAGHPTIPETGYLAPVQKTVRVKRFFRVEVFQMVK